MKWIFYQGSVVFISNNRDIGYGADKGTGAFGDSIRYGKYLIIPDFADVDNEFKFFQKDIKLLVN